MKNVAERTTNVSNDTGFMMELHETSLTSLDLRWGNYVSPSEQTLTVHPDKNSIVSHFQLTNRTKNNLFVVCREISQPHDINIATTKNNLRHNFFELIMTESLFDNMMIEESRFLADFRNCKSMNISSFAAGMSAQMYQIIFDMKNTAYSGELKRLYLETKAIELFLSEVYQFDYHQKPSTRLKPKDVDCLNDLKEYLDANFLSPFSILDLSKKAGINQTKLKSGFKQLFDSTIFGYIGNLRLEEAKKLLLDEQMSVNEVSEFIGYKHSHHFTVAFKRKFNCLPSQVKYHC